MGRLCAWVIGALLASTLGASAASPALKGLGFDERLAAEPVLAPALDRTGVPLRDFPVFLRLIIRAEDLQPGAGLERVAARLDLYARRKIPVLLTIADPPLAQGAVDGWRTPLRSLVERCRGKVVGYQVGDRLDEGAFHPSAQAYAYLVKFVAVQARSIDPAAIIVQAGLPGSAMAWQEELYAQDAAPYIDGVPLDASPNGPAVDAASHLLDSLVARLHPAATVGAVGFPLGEPAGQLPFVSWHLAHLGGRAAFTTGAGTVDEMTLALKAAAGLKDVIAGELVTLDEHASSLRLTLDGRDVTASLAHRLLYNMTTFASYLLCWPDAQAAGALEVRLHLANAGTPALREPGAAAVRKLTDGRDEAARTSSVRFDLAAGRTVLVDFNYGAEQVYALRADAAEHALPTVEEIVVRHQQAEVAQQDKYRNYLAHARVNLHFRPTATDSGYDVVLENRFFWDAEAVEWEEQGFILNGTRWGRNRPPFPMLQPEKVLSLPLSLRFNRDYAYHLDGVERLGDRRCYVVRFDPVNTAQSLYRGRVWIDAERYVRLKVQAVQTLLTPPVVSNEEVQTFSPVTARDGSTVYLFSRLESKQIMLLAGRNVLVEKQVSFSEFRLDDPAFEQERTRSRAGDNVMYRDTDQGLRYLVKRGRERVVSDRLTTTAKAFIMGASFDPSYDYPVPMGGLDYIDFNFLNKDLQFALIFAGVVAIGNVQKARVAGSRFDVNVDFFGIALSGNDQVYDDKGERKGERLRTRPASAGVNLGYQLTDFQKVTTSVHVQHDTYLSAPDDTAAGFVVPASGVTLNTGLAYEYRRAGYSFVASGSYSSRATWRKWGLAEQAFDPAARTYTKYSVSANKDIFFNPFSKLHLNASFYGGQRQDRFSMYRFGLFDETRMRGVPSAGVRFAEMAMQRAQYSFNLLELYRLDLFYDHAWGRTDERAGWSRTTGIGTEVSLRGPVGTMLKVGVGKGYLPRVYKGSGSWVVELTVLKPL